MTQKCRGAPPPPLSLPRPPRVVGQGEMGAQRLPEGRVGCGAPHVGIAGGEVAELRDRRGKGEKVGRGEVVPRIPASGDSHQHAVLDSVAKQVVCDAGHSEFVPAAQPLREGLAREDRAREEVVWIRRLPESNLLVLPDKAAANEFPETLGHLSESCCNSPRSEQVRVSAIILVLQSHHKVQTTRNKNYCHVLMVES